MVFYLCDGQIPRCMGDVNCKINSPLGGCMHTIDSVHARHQELTKEEEFKKALDAGKFHKVKFGPVTQFWEKTEEVYE